MRRGLRRLGLVVAALAAVCAALYIAAGDMAGSVAAVATLFATVFGACWLLGEHDADRREDAWLRSVLGGLGAPGDAGEADGSDDLYIA